MKRLLYLVVAMLISVLALAQSNDKCKHETLPYSGTIHAQHMDARGNNTFVTTDSSAYNSNDLAKQWNKSFNVEIPNYAGNYIAATDSAVFISISSLDTIDIGAAMAWRIFASKDNGISWSRVYTTRGRWPILHKRNNTVYFIDVAWSTRDSANYVLVSSSNYGRDWDTTQLGTMNYADGFVRDVRIGKDNVIYVEYQYGIPCQSNSFYKLNSDGSKTLLFTINTSSSKWFEVDAHGNIALADNSSLSGGVFRSTDHGASWDTLYSLNGHNGVTIRGLYLSDKDRLYIPDYGGLFSIRHPFGPKVSIDTLIIGATINTVCGNGKDVVFAGGFDGIVNNGGASPDENTVSSTNTASTLWSITEIDTSASVTSVKYLNGNTNGFTLNQNYPNPFNPSTTISYSLKTASHVSLSVYNTIGQEVATLVNELQVAGTHSVKFDASNLASGMYIYKVTFNQNSFTGKMILMK